MASNYIKSKFLSTATLFLFAMMLNIEKIMTEIFLKKLLSNFVGFVCRGGDAFPFHLAF